MPNFKENGEFRPRVHEVKSETIPNKTYLVTNYLKNHWTCSCKDFIYRCHTPSGRRNRKLCKHIIKIKEAKNVEIQ